MNEPSIYCLRKPKTVWGDYDDILLAGIATRLAKSNGLLQLERTGPFIPPISFPGIDEIIVTDKFKTLLEASQLTGLSFQQVIKKRIVFLEWERWDKHADEPTEYPESGEPEDYILGKPHMPELAEGIGDLWELRLITYEAIPKAQIDFFRLAHNRWNYVSIKARDWLGQRVADFVQFQPIYI